MTYSYRVERHKVFTEEGQRMFLAIRDHVKELLETAGAVTVGKAMGADVGGDSWTMLACIDRMVELGELRYVSQTGATQDWVLV